MKPSPSPLYILKNRFTGINGVSLCLRSKLREDKEPAGKNLGSLCLFGSRGDAKSLADLGNNFQGQLRWQTLHPSHWKQAMPQSMTFKRFLRPFLPQVLFAGLFLGVLLWSFDLWAHDGALLKDEITALEKLFTGGYMRLGLLGVCGFAAIYGIVKQSGWIFASGILGCVFAYFMKDWVLKTFTAVI